MESIFKQFSIEPQVAFNFRPELNGEPIDIYLHQTDYSDIRVSEDQLSVQIFDRDRAYLSTSPVPDKDKYFKINLLGGWMSYDVDLSELPCGCITALY